MTTVVGEIGERDRASGSELLGFYDQVRSAVSRYLERRGGRLGRRAAEALLLVPDVLLLLIRLFLDGDTPRSSRALIGGALAYFLLPADLAPEIVLGPIGFLDDLMVACTVLSHAFGPELGRIAERHWSGDRRSLEGLTDWSSAGSSLLGAGMSERIQTLVERRLLKSDRRASDGA